MVYKTISGMLLEVYHKVLLCLRSLKEHFVQYLLELIRKNTSWIERQSAEFRKGFKDATDQLEALALRLTAD